MHRFAGWVNVSCWVSAWHVIKEAAAQGSGHVEYEHREWRRDMLR
jgi:hypothetical protein